MSVIVDKINGLTANTAIKAPCKAATTADVTLSGEQTIDDIALVEGDRVLVKDQSTASENGIYEVSTSSWQRAKDFNGSRDARQGTYVLVNQGTVNSNTLFRVSTADDFTIGTSDLSFATVPTQGPQGPEGPQGPQGPPGISDTAISSNDTNPGYLEDKITVDSTFLATSVANEGADEDFNIAPTDNAKNAMNLYLYNLT